MTRSSELANGLNPNPTQTELNEFAETLKQRVIQELEAWHPRMHVLARNIEQGWDELVTMTDLSLTGNGCILIGSPL